MESENAINTLLLPERTRLFYIGPMKTGTTSLQQAAHAARATMYRHGVYYPGKGRNHRLAINAFLKRPDTMVAGRTIIPGQSVADVRFVPSENTWNSLIEDIESEPEKRIMISHEFASNASEEEAKRFVDELGPSCTHIAITLRPLSDMLRSHWIERIKSGERKRFDEWLTTMLDPEATTISTNLKRQTDQAALVERWANAVGPENVTVIVASSDDKNLSTSAFEEMLGLPERTLTGSIQDGRLSNRSLSQSEAELIRQLNVAVNRPDELSWHVYREVIQRGSVFQMLEHPSSTKSDPKVRIPAWAADTIVELAIKHVRRIEATGVRIVGNLESLCYKPIVATEDVENSDTIQLDIAANALIGSVNGAMNYENKLSKQIDKLHRRIDRSNEKRRNSKHKAENAKRNSLRSALDQFPAEKQPDKAARALSTRQLMRALKIRLVYKLRYRRSMPLK